MSRKGTKTKRRIDLNSLVMAYLTAKELVIESGFADEIDWQYSSTFSTVTESILREGAW